MLKKVNYIGEKCFHVFSTPNGRVEVEVSRPDYDLLATSSTQPTYPDGTWVNSYCRPCFDTPDGKLGDDQWGDVGNYKMVKLTGFSETSLDSVDVSSDGTVSKKGQDKATNPNNKDGNFIY